MTTPRAEPIARSGRGTGSSRDDTAATADWADVVERLRRGEGTSWLGVRGRGGGVHLRPLFAAWAGSSFVFTTKATAAKTRHLEVDGAVSLAVDLGPVHLVVEGTAARLVAPADLARAAAAMREVYDWPADVVGEELDAPYAAPTSGGPPFQAWELVPARAFGLPTADEFEPTRWTFARATEEARTGVSPAGPGAPARPPAGPPAPCTSPA